MFVDGVTVEFQRRDGGIAGALVRLVDFDDPGNNDWLAVNQFTVIDGQEQPPGRCGDLRERTAAGRRGTQEPGR